MENNVIILAGGQGKRMKTNMPKALCNVIGEPMLEWVLTACENAELDDICVVKGYEGQQIEDYLDARKSKANICTVMQEERLGTGHAVMQAADFLKAHAEGNTLILCGDAPFIDAETIKGALELHTEKDCGVTVVTSRVENPTGYGRIIRTENGISGIVEHKDCTPMQLAITEINSGCYWFKTADLLEVLFLTSSLRTLRANIILQIVSSFLLQRAKRLTHLFLQILMLHWVQMTDVVCLH